jgi:pimeloyl-ACP methyl ester carboxylesterase/class 3 adenylate cyclase
MKQCPKCQRVYPDDELKFCRADGAPLTHYEVSSGEQATRVMPSSPHSSESARVSATRLASEASALSTKRPETKYARSGDINIAYQVIGEGPVDIVYVPGWVSHLEYGWEEPSLARFYRRLGSFSRLILFDKRGTGLSDQTPEPPTLEQRMDDVRAVMEAVGSERAIVFGMSEGGNMAMLFAATYPERTIALITFGVYAKRVYEPDYPWAPTPEQRQGFYDAIEQQWGGPIGVEDLAPSLAGDDHFREWWASYQRRSASPRAALALARMNTLIDVRHVLPAIRVPTLVMHRTGDLDCNIEEGRYIAARISGARFVELPGNDHLLFVGDQDSVLNEVEKFIQGIEHVQETDSVLATIVYTEICIPETNAQTASDNQQPELSKQFHALVKRETEWFKGRPGKAMGLGFCATFDGPIRAIRCARAMSSSARELGIQIKTGLHTGLCEVRGDDIQGTSVEISKGVAASASAGEVLVSNTVKDLVSGSGTAFEERGTLSFNGIPGEWQLFAAS